PTSGARDRPHPFRCAGRARPAPRPHRARLAPVDIGEITGAWDYATLPGNVRIGDGCFVERRESFKRFRSTRDAGLVLGTGVKVYTWTEFNVEPSGAIRVGDDSTLVGAVFMCAEDITIGKRVIVSYNVTIADCDFHPHDPALRKQDAIANAPEGDRNQRPPLITRPVVIEDEVWIGIGAIVVVGARSWLYSSFAFLHYYSRRSCGVRVGHDSGVYNGTFFDLGPSGEVDVGDYCTLVGAMISSNGRVEIGDYSFISHEVVLADSFAALPWVSEAAPSSSVRQPPELSISIGSNAWIGARAILLRGARIGEGAIVGAATVVDFEVPPHAIVAGNPARVLAPTPPREPTM
ncbi:MAG: transferase hexapeptide repeat containing protein, partial [Chloroflexi bacterium]|nr:transferase hexapeptide repeat containing protein [Chloroflexota bacterium]